MQVPRPPSPSAAKNDAKKKRNWTRLRFQRTRRHLDPVETDEKGYPSAQRSTVKDADAESSISDNSGLPIDHPMKMDCEILSY